MLVLFSLIFLREIKSAHTKLENQNAQLDRIAGIDALTGLYNRRSMDKFLAAAMSCPNDFSIIMCDIDDF
ncbi:MAG: diguanylate cyclase [Ruminococcus sp.]|nr:MAG: diguanylate cyclase [Ruminococcus sp.]